MITAKDIIRTELEYVSDQIKEEPSLNYFWDNVLNAIVFLENDDLNEVQENISEAKTKMVKTCTGNWFRIFAMLDVIQMAIIRLGVE